MKLFDRAAAERAIEALNLTRSNGEMALRWLHLWEDGRLPTRQRFHPVNFKAFLPTIVLFNVVPNASVTIRLAGTRYAHLLGREMTGMDWIAAAPEAHRATRLRNFSAVAEGAIVVDHRRLASEIGEDYVAEEILLPFAPDADGVVPVLAHVNLPLDRYLKIKSAVQTIGEPMDWAVVALPEDTSGKRAQDGPSRAA